MLQSVGGAMRWLSIVTIFNSLVEPQQFNRLSPIIIVELSMKKQFSNRSLTTDSNNIDFVHWLSLLAVNVEILHKLLPRYCQQCFRRYVNDDEDNQQFTRLSQSVVK